MKNSKLIDALNNCVAHCNYCADACLDEKNIQMMVDCIRTDKVCAEVCSATAKILATSYEDVNDLIKYCHKLCIECAKECEKHKDHHQHCKECADACRKCAAACEEYLNS